MIKAQLTSVNLRQLPSAFAATTITLALIAASAHGAATRAEYVLQVDPICQRASKPMFNAFGSYINAAVKKGAEKQTDPRLAGPTARLHARIASLYGSQTTQIAAVPPAPGDESIVASWLDARARVVTNLDRARKAAKHRKMLRSKRISSRAGFGTASHVVSDFGLRYCAPQDGAVVVGPEVPRAAPTD